MAKRRRAVNPASVKADLSVLEDAPPAEIFQRRINLRRKLGVVLLNLLAIVLLSVSFAPFDCWYLAYVALVPWAAALVSTRLKRWTIFSAWLGGAVFWTLNVWWLSWVTGIGYVAVVFYLSLYWLAAALVVRAALRRNWPMWLVLPIVWTALEYARAYVISGFPWFYLAHSQYRQVRLIQIADLTGQYGVSFFVAMVNGALVDLLVLPLFVRGRRGPRLRRQLPAGLIASAASLAAILAYGTFRLGQQTTEPGPVIGIVQQAFPITLSGRSVTAEKILNTHVAACEKFVSAKCNLVVGCPETMLPPGLNASLLTTDLAVLEPDALRSLGRRILGPQVGRIVSDEELRHALRVVIEGGHLDDGQRIAGLKDYARQVGDLSRRLDCPILAGGATFHRNPRPIDRSDLWVTRNSALWFDRTWKSSAEYSKVHLVPFSEYVPYKHSWPWLHRTLRRCVPEQMSQLDPGTTFTRFELPRKSAGRQPWRIAAPICYEGTFARVCRKMVIRKGVKSVDVLANLSNDGWFVFRMPGKQAYRGSTEHAQHLVAYCFRAIENRVPVVRAVNTGISASIDSNGRIVAELSKFGQRTMIAGTLLLDGAKRNEREYLAGHGPKVLVDDRVSMYSLFGDVFAIAVSLAAILIVVRLVWKRPGPDEGDRK